MMHSSRRFSRVLATVCGVAVLLGATACHDGGSTMKAGSGQESGPTLDTDGEPFIHANHNRGAKPGVTIGELKTQAERDAYDDEFIEWGLQQTPDWLEICNTINKHELRKLGIDPQKDLLQREGGEGKRWACGWKHALDVIVLIARHDKPLEEVSVEPRFELDHKVTVNGRPANVGRIMEEYPISQACAVDYYYKSTVYTVSYRLVHEPDNSDAACTAAIALAERA